MSCQGSVRQTLLRTADQRCLLRDLSARHSCRQIIKAALSGICPQDALADRSPKILSLGSVRQSLLRADEQRCLVRDLSARASCGQMTKDVFAGIRPLDTLADRSSKRLHRGSVRKTLLRTDHQRYFFWDLSARAFCGQMPKDVSSGIGPPELCGQMTKDVFSRIRLLDTLADRSPKRLYRESVRKTLLRTDHQRYFLWDLSARAFCGQINKDFLSGICPPEPPAAR